MPRYEDDGPDYDAEFFRELLDNIANWGRLDHEDRPQTSDRALFHKRVRDRPIVNIELPDVIEVKNNDL